MKINIKYFIFCAIMAVSLAACSINLSSSITVPEYTKEVVVQNTKFNASIEDILDQIETYNGNSESTDRLNKLIDSALDIINYLSDNLGPKVPKESAVHYKSMMGAYAIYKEGLELYRDNIPRPLTEERNNNIRSAENKFEEGKNALKNIK